LPKVLTEWFARLKGGGRSPERRFDGLASLEVKADLRTPKRNQTDKTFGNQYRKIVPHRGNLMGRRSRRDRAILHALLEPTFSDNKGIHMKRFVFSAFMLLLCAVGAPHVLAQVPVEPLFQVSTFNALKKGLYHGYVSYEDLRKNGDFGIGTVDGLDGEMVALDGQFFQIRVDGKAYPIPDSARTPFAVVTFFKPQTRVSIESAHSLRELHDALERLVLCKDLPYAIKVEGNFTSIEVRSVARQNMPYPDLASALSHQVKFPLRKVQGTLVGFRFPEYMDGVNVAGYHFHFITADKQAGGHVLDCSGAGLTADLVPTSRVLMEMAPSCP
jgi:acetolactate decarboxylase